MAGQGCYGDCWVDTGYEMEMCLTYEYCYCGAYTPYSGCGCYSVEIATYWCEVYTIEVLSCECDINLGNCTCDSDRTCSKDCSC